MNLGKRVAIGCGGFFLLLLLMTGFGTIGSYNSLNALIQSVDGQWGQIENVYQRRADLVPNLVETVKGAANFEKETFIAVTEARAKVGQISTQGRAPNSPEAMSNFSKTQDNLGSALSRLLVVVEKYPDLKASHNFQDLQVQLEGTENRIATERMRFNQAVQAFNTKRNNFPTIMLVGFLGDRFRERPYFKSQTNADIAPKIKF